MKRLFGADDMLNLLDRRLQHAPIQEQQRGKRLVLRSFSEWSTRSLSGALHSSHVSTGFRVANGCGWKTDAQQLIR